MSRPPYQDVWRDGRLVTKGRRECARRFEAIRDHVGPVGSVLDVGGWDGYFSRRFAEAGAEVTLIEPRNVADVPDGVTHRQERVDASTAFPRVDVALALAVLHHMPDWEQVYEALRRRSDTLVVEVAHPDELDGPLSQTLVDTGDRIAPTYERLIHDGEVIATTGGPNGVRRPLVAIANRWEGTVGAGKGRAAEVMTDRPAGFFDPLGYQPHPGTLNVKVGRDGKSWAKRLPAPVTLDGTGGGTAGPYWPVTIGGVDAHVRTSRAQTVVEVVAPVNLRDALGVVDGDPVTLEPR